MNNTKGPFRALTKAPSGKRGPTAGTSYQSGKQSRAAMASVDSDKPKRCCVRCKTPYNCGDKHCSCHQ